MNYRSRHSHQTLQTRSRSGRFTRGSTDGVSETPNSGSHWESVIDPELLPSTGKDPSAPISPHLTRLDEILPISVFVLGSLPDSEEGSLRFRTPVLRLSEHGPVHNGDSHDCLSVLSDDYDVGTLRL